MCYTKYSILLDPQTFSVLEDEGTSASDFLKWLEVEVCQVVARQVEIRSRPFVKVMFYCRPVPTSHLAWPCSTYFASILGLSSQALLACLVGAGDAVDDPGVLAGDALLHGPRLSSQGARVCICVG